MRWFSGSIVEAVNLSKSKNALFVVYVEGDSEHAKEMSAMLNDERVASRLETEKFVAIKIISGSQDYMQFAQIYQIVPVPSLFFIGKNGTPLEVIVYGLDTERLLEKIDLLPSQSGASGSPLEETANSARPSTSNASSTLSSQNLIANEIANEQQTIIVDTNVKKSTGAISKMSSQGDKNVSVLPPKRQKSEEFEVICDGDVCVRKPKATVENEEMIVTASAPSEDNLPLSVPETPFSPAERLSPVEPSSPVDRLTPVEQDSQLALEERTKKAQELIEQKRREKAEKEKEGAKAREAERRQTGKGVVELKRWQEEQEMKNLQEERKREKLENDKARAKILEQIAQDRAERRARDPAGISNVNLKPTVVPSVAPTTLAAGNTETKIQFKLGDGTSKAAKFTADTTLSEIRDYVTTILQIKPPFALWMMFPRRAFSEEENTSNLAALGLVPSAVLLVVGEGPAATSKPSSGSPAKVEGTFTNIYNIFIHLMWSLFVSPAQLAWSWISGGGNGRRGPEKRRADGQPSRSTSESPNSSRAGTSHRRHGENIRRLRGSTPPPDDNNTWNGNSTQQM